MTGNPERRCQGGAQSGACAATRRASNTLTPKAEEARGTESIRPESSATIHRRIDICCGLPGNVESPLRAKRGRD